MKKIVTSSRQYDKWEPIQVLLEAVLAECSLFRSFDIRLQSSQHLWREHWHCSCAVLSRPWLKKNLRDTINPTLRSCSGSHTTKLTPMTARRAFASIQKAADLSGKRAAWKLQVSQLSPEEMVFLDATTTTVCVGKSDIGAEKTQWGPSAFPGHLVEPCSQPRGREGSCMPRSVCVTSRFGGEGSTRTDEDHL